MKKILIVLSLFALPLAGCETAKQILDSAGNGTLTNAEIIQGLKEALRVGADTSTRRLSLLNGFFGDAAIKILMPPEALKVEKNSQGCGSW